MILAQRGNPVIVVGKDFVSQSLGKSTGVEFTLDNRYDSDIEAKYFLIMRLIFCITSIYRVVDVKMYSLFFFLKLPAM